MLGKEASKEECIKYLEKKILEWKMMVRMSVHEVGKLFFKLP